MTSRWCYHLHFETWHNIHGKQQFRLLNTIHVSQTKCGNSHVPTFSCAHGTAPWASRLCAEFSWWWCPADHRTAVTSLLSEIVSVQYINITFLFNRISRRQKILFNIWIVSKILQVNHPSEIYFPENYFSWIQGVFWD